MPSFDEPILVKDTHGKTTVRISAGTTGNSGEPVVLRGESAELVLGGGGADGDLFVRNGAGQVTVHLRGRDGDVLLSGADCAERFVVLEPEGIEAGTVLVVAEGGLRRCAKAYDRRVAGVVSGAGPFKPGIQLGADEQGQDSAPIALVGRVRCKVDADHGPIELGDLLTTSPTPGHAMRAADPLSAFGAVLGKALEPLAAGRGLITILVCLQ